MEEVTPDVKFSSSIVEDKSVPLRFNPPAYTVAPLSDDIQICVTVLFPKTTLLFWEPIAPAPITVLLDAPA